jgi:hypothetical protein
MITSPQKPDCPILELIEVADREKELTSLGDRLLIKARQVNQTIRKRMSTIDGRSESTGSGEISGTAPGA